MSDSIIYTVLSLSGLGVSASFLLFFVAKKFNVYEDPRIDEVESILPGANCGGCGVPGCKNFATLLVETPDITQLHCPVGGNETMKKISEYLGKEVAEKPPMVAVLLCNGSIEARNRIVEYDGPKSCKIADIFVASDSACDYGCDGFGDCTRVCDFDAIHMDPATNLPVVDFDKCTACNACVVECPKGLLELRPKVKKGLKIYVACKSQEKGGIAKKACEVACIACSKCFDVCPKDAITIENNLAYIHADLCTLCRKCVPVCPTFSIIETGFPPKAEKKIIIEKTEEIIKI